MHRIQIFEKTSSRSGDGRFFDHAGQDRADPCIIGGLNWGCIGLFQFDLVAWIFGGSGSLLARIVYTLVGLAAVWCISLLFRNDAAAQTKPQSQ